MSGTMSMTDLVADLKASLHDAASVFVAANDGDFERHINVASLELARFRPRTLVGSITLVADQPDYDAPSDISEFKSSLWGIAPKKRVHPWERGWPGRLPCARMVEVDGTRKLYLDPPPDAGQINALGDEFRFYYFALHSIDDSDGSQTTIRPKDRELLMLRAQAEAMREMAMRNIMKPVQLRAGVGSMPKNGTPAYLYAQLMQEFEEKAC